ncbi:MAG TPA: D-glycerate dehydrogenase [Bacillales bacterium]|nr:D-glycerate dehydrogenase [Bacillales bacterium]
MDHVVVYQPIPEFLLEKLQQKFSVSHFNKVTDDNRSEFEQKVQGADGLLGAGWPITRAFLDKAPNLRVVSNISAGYDNFDIEELTKRGIMATNSPDALTETTADLIFGLLLSSARRIAELDRLVRMKQWNGAIKNKHFGVDVHHKTIGIVGMGRIGRAVARRAALGFNMKVLYHRRSRDKESERMLGAEYCDLPELLGSSDYVCLTLPLTDSTYHLIDEQEFNQMKPEAILINGGRGPLLNEEALVTALKNNTIMAAGLDVYEKEPLSHDSELLSMRNVVLSPHTGSATEETRTQMAVDAVENLLQALQGETPMNLLNPEVE